MRTTTDPGVAAEALAAGRLVVVPTETVYGLGARADLPRAIARVYAAKGRPADHPLIVHVAEARALDAWATHVPDFARGLADEFWPGPLTLVVRRSDRAGDFVTGGQDTVAVRVPAHPMMRELLTALAVLTSDPSIGVAAPSANRFGRVSPTLADHVREELGSVLGPDDVLLDGGPCEVGLESTIVDCTADRPVVLRPGRVSVADVEQVTGLVVGLDSPVRAPGTLAAHYAPQTSVSLASLDELTRTPVSPGQAPIGVLALASVPTPPGMVRLSAPTTADDYARVLYAALREADALGLDRVLAVPPPALGVGSAIADRLARAAAGG